MLLECSNSLDGQLCAGEIFFPEDELEREDDAEADDGRHDEGDDERALDARAEAVARPGTDSLPAGDGLATDGQVVQRLVDRDRVVRTGGSLVRLRNANT